MASVQEMHDLIRQIDPTYSDDPSAPVSMSIFNRINSRASWTVYDRYLKLMPCPNTERVNIKELSLLKLLLADYGSSIIQYKDSTGVMRYNTFYNSLDQIKVIIAHPDSRMVFVNYITTPHNDIYPILIGTLTYIKAVIGYPELRAVIIEYLNRVPCSYWFNSIDFINLAVEYPEFREVFHNNYGKNHYCQRRLIQKCIYPSAQCIKTITHTDVIHMLHNIHNINCQASEVYQLYVSNSINGYANHRYNVSEYIRTATDFQNTCTFIEKDIFDIMSKKYKTIDSAYYPMTQISEILIGAVQHANYALIESTLKFMQTNRHQGPYTQLMTSDSGNVWKLAITQNNMTTIRMLAEFNVVPDPMYLEGMNIADYTRYYCPGHAHEIISLIDNLKTKQLANASNCVQDDSLRTITTLEAANQRLSEKNAKLTIANAELKKETDELQEQLAKFNQENAQLMYEKNRLSSVNEFYDTENKNLVNTVRLLTKRSLDVPEENAKLTAANTKLIDENKLITDENAKLTAANAKLIEQNTKLSDENKLLEYKTQSALADNADLREENESMWRSYRELTIDRLRIRRELDSATELSIGKSSSDTLKMYQQKLQRYIDAYGDIDTMVRIGV